MLERICGRFSRRVTALLLAVCMVISMSPPVTAAGVSYKDSGEPVVLSGFAVLPEHIRKQSVPIGTSSVELDLPDTLEATAEQTAEAKALGLSSGDFEGATKTVTVGGVTWESDPAYEGETEGTYTFTAVLPDGYSLEDGVAMPEIAVTVGLALKKALTSPATSGDFGDNCKWKITEDDGVLTIEAKDETGGTLPDSWERLPWFDYIVDEDLVKNVKKVVVKDGVKSNTNLSGFFQSINYCTEIDLTGLDTSAATNMSKMFMACPSLKTITFGNKFDTQNVTDMSDMFFYCAELEPEKFDVLKGKLNTANVTNMKGMFTACHSFVNITLDDTFKTKNVTDMSEMFKSCEGLKSITFDTGFDTSKVENMSAMFFGCTRLESITFDTGFDTSKVKNMREMFTRCGALKKLDLSEFKTEQVTDMSAMFAMSSLEDLNVSSFDTSNVTDMNAMFSDIDIETLNVSSFDTAKVTDMSYMFYCQKLKTLDVSNFNTAEVKNMSNMFAYCPLSTLDLGNFDTSKVTDMSGMFSWCNNFETIDISSFDTSKVKNMSAMFKAYKADAIYTNPSKLKQIIRSDKFTTENVELFDSMFENCVALTELDLSDFNTSKAQGMMKMFSNCTGLTELDLSGFDCTALGGGWSGENCTEEMFSDCSKLKTVSFPKVTRLDVKCFSGCGALTSLTLGAAPPETYSNPFNFDPVEGGKLGLVLALPNGTPLTESTNPKLSDAVDAYKAVDADGDTTDNLWWGWKIGSKPSLPAEATPNITINYANEKLTGFVPGGSYTVNGTAVSPAADGTLAIDTGWFGTTVSIVKKASDTATHTDSAAQSLAIPARPAAPNTPGKTDETVGGAKDGKLTGLTADTAYQISIDGGTTWTNKTADSTGSVTGLAPGSYIVRVPATGGGFAGAPSVPVIIAGGPKADIGAKLTVTIGGWAYGEAAKAPTTTASGVTIDQSKLSYTYSGRANDGTTLTSSAAAPAKSGSYTVTAKYEDSTQIGSAVKSFTVDKAPLTITGGTVTTRSYTAGDKTATVTAVTFGGLKNGETLAITTDYTVTGAEFADANVGTNKPVTATAALQTTAKTANYTLSNSQLNTTGTITKIADGTKNPDYPAALAELKKVHIITNVTPTPGDVTLPAGWSFTGDSATRLAGIEGQANQNFAVKYTSQNPNYPDVAIAAQPFPVTTVLMDVQNGLSMVMLNKDEVKDIAPVTVAVKGAPLPNSGDYAESNIGLFSALPKIATISGNVGVDQGAVNVTGVAKGLTMVGIAYKNTPTMMLGYILIQVNDPAASSQNNIEEIKDIGDTLERLIADPSQPTAVEQATVNAVASEITKLPDAAKEQLKVDDVKKIDALQQVVQNITVTPALPVVSGAPTLASNFTVVGAAVSSGAAANDTVTITATPKPVSGEVKMELDLTMTVGGGEQQLKSPLFFEMELPAGIDMSKLKIKHIMESGSEEISFTASGQTISFKLNSFSGLQFIVSSGGTPTPPPSGGDGGSSGDDGYDFWMQVKDKIEKADDGDVIKVTAKDYDKMPESVMDTLRKNDDVSLVITWNDKPITIPAGKAQKNEPGRIYWPLSLLAELYAGITEDTVLKLEPQNPETGGPGKYIPVTGGELITLEAPAPAVKNAIPDATENAQAITPTQPKAITPPDAGFEADAFVGTPDAKAASTNTVKTFCLIDLVSGGLTSFNCWWCWIALLSLTAVGTALVIKSRKKKTV